MDVSFSENGSVTFAVEATDVEGDGLSYSWFLDGIFRTVNAAFSWFFDFFSAGYHNVTAYVSDSEHNTSNYWNVSIFNTVNRFWTVIYAAPTPANNTDLSVNSFNVSIDVVLTGVEEPEAMEFVDGNKTEFDLGAYDGTMWNSTVPGVVLNWSLASQQLFFDDFEGANLSSNGWLTSGAGVPWFIETFESYAGTNHTEAGGTGSESVLSRNVSTQGFQNVTLSFWWDTDLLDAGEYLAADYYNGIGWTNVLFNDTNPVNYTLFNLTLGAVADNNSAFAVRFRCLSSLGTEECKVDNVGVRGERKVFPAGGNYTSQAFNATEVIIWSNVTWAQNTPASTSLKFQARSCNDSLCAGEEFTGPDGTATTYYTSSPGVLNAANNTYFQYKAYLETNDSTVTPKIYAMTIKGHTIVPPTPETNITTAWVVLNGNLTLMSGQGLSWSKLFSNLNYGQYNYTAHAQDQYGNMNYTLTRTVTIPSYNINFSVTSGEDGSGRNGANITCNYSGLDQAGNATNPYGPFRFPTGNWECNFKSQNFYNKTITFTADSNKVVSVVMEREFSLTIQEHDWIREVYGCVVMGNCTAYNMWQSTNATTEKIWNKYLPTNPSVVTREQNISLTLSSTQNISINYTLNIPFKEGYDNRALLPIRIFYWFTDANGNCYSQDKQTDANNAASPYCVPLIATYLGPNNGTTEFRVDLRPNLPTGTYQITRQIDIDPIENNEPVWINYGREAIGKITVLGNNVDNTVKNLEKPGRTTAKALDTGVGAITGAAIGALIDKSSFLAGAIVMLLVISLLGNCWFIFWRKK